MISFKYYSNFYIFSIFLLLTFLNVCQSNNEYREQHNTIYKPSNLKKEDDIEEINKKSLKSVGRRSYLSSDTKANIYVIADVSSNVPSDAFADLFTNFFMEFFNNFQVNPSYINVAFTTSPGDRNTWLYLPSFNSFYSNTSLKDFIHSSYYPPDAPQSSGQEQLKDILSMALNDQFLQTGYNDSYKPHIIFYLTTTSTPDASAINQAQIIRNSNKFRIISIGYQMKENVGGLENMSDCLYRANNADDLSALSSALASLVVNANIASTEIQC